MSDKRDLTLLVMAGETAPVRRLRVKRAWFKQAAIAGGLLVVALGGVGIDYVRLRRDAIDVEEMRADTTRRREELDALKAEIGGLSQQFEGMRELERKVRVIANLPDAVQEARVPSDAGQGGAEDTDGANDAEPAIDAQPSSAEHHEDSSAAASPEAELRAALDRIETRARRLSTLFPEQRASLEALVAGLEDRREQLAATPSIWPTNGYVTSGYGFRTSPFTGRKQFHAGIDIAADYGTRIISPASGRVVFAGRRGAFGRVVEIDHGFGVRTIYGHTEDIYVRVGERVERGTRIASVGSTGPHLHYQVKAQGKTVNPSDYIFE
ncbi:MAG: M23 family metallopeptidase [Deltaproteobacteria bacterium]|nr:M23 family metallopeptidase [Deltaproteobacteria bacterium]